MQDFYFFGGVIHPSVKSRGQSRLQAPLMEDYTNQGGKIPFQRVHNVRKNQDSPLNLSFPACPGLGLLWLHGMGGSGRNCTRGQEQLLLSFLSLHFWEHGAAPDAKCSLGTRGVGGTECWHRVMPALQGDTGAGLYPDFPGN